MLKIEWRQILYEDQPFPKNYFKLMKRRKTNEKKKSMTEILLFLQNIASVFFYFVVYHQIKQSSSLSYSVVSFIGFYAFFNFRKFHVKRIFPCFVKFALIFVNVPIFKSLVSEIDDDTIYLHCVWLTFLFVLDKTKCSIMNLRTKKFKIKTPLKIEHVDFLKESTKNIPFLGYNTVLMATFLLISRVSSSGNAFFLICFTLFWFIYLNPKNVNRKFYLLITLFTIFYTFVLLLCINLMLSLIYLFFNLFLIFVSVFILYFI